MIFNLSCHGIFKGPFIDPDTGRSVVTSLFVICVVHENAVIAQCTRFCHETQRDFKMNSSNLKKKKNIYNKVKTTNSTGENH